MTEQKLEAALNKEMFFIVLRWKIRQHHPDKTKMHSIQLHLVLREE
jgi:hypothetical protein